MGVRTMYLYACYNIPTEQNIRKIELMLKVKNA